VIRIVIDYSNELPIAVHKDGNVETYDRLDITDKLGNTVAQMTVDPLGHVVIVVKGNAYPSKTEAVPIQGRRPRNRPKPCGCFEG
jgi:hypothetical protein